MSGISLTASMRSNLLSLQNISGQVSSTQNKLATGNKVNSAIDNPSSYYTALSLNNRADDLNALLDSMGQAVSTIKAATTALESAAGFLEQASAVATQALETAKIPSKSWFASQEDVAAVVSTWDELKAALESGKQGNIVIYGNIEAQNTITLNAGQNLVGIGYYGIDEPDVDKFSQLNFDLEAIGKTEAINISADNAMISDISIKSKMKKDVINQVILISSSKNTTFHNLDIMMDNSKQDSYKDNSVARSIGINFGSLQTVTLSGTNNIYEKSKVENKEILSYGIYYGSTLNTKCTLQGTLNIQMKQSQSRGFNGTALELQDGSKLNITGANRALESVNLIAHGNSHIKITNAKIGFCYGAANLYDNTKLEIESDNTFYSTISEGKELPLEINIYSANVSVNSQSTFNTFTNYAQRLLTVNAVAGSIFGINGKLYQAQTETHDNTVQGNVLSADWKELSDKKAEEIMALDWINEQNNNRDFDYNYENETGADSSQYTEIISQYDALIKDAGYKGINLLQTDKLTVKFNESNSANLEVNGKDMSSTSLGILTTDWRNQTDITQAVRELTVAINSIRSYSSELGNNYNIITTRQDFTNSLINVLTEGADKLTLADMNEESANMLALQTRQQLAINSLSLASQASQSILKLF